MALGDILADVGAGYNNNYNNSFTAENLKPQGQNFANRVGEGLGTLGRFIDSPLGRGLMAYGLNNALGYGNSLKEGLTAFSGRQNAVNQDKLYKQQLQSLGYDTTGLGEIDKDSYKMVTDNILKTQKMQLQEDLATARDNTQRAKILTQAVNNGTMTPESAQAALKLYGIDTEFQESNQTRKTDAQIKKIDNDIAATKQRLVNAQRRLAQGDRSLGLREELQALNKQYKALQIKKLQEELSDGSDIGTPTTTTTKHKTNAF